MQIYLLLNFFLVGIVFGSFYNVVIYRMPNDISITKGRSACPNCNTTLKALDLVPIFSYLFLGAKCRYCGNKISIRYPVIELITGMLFSLAFLLYGISVYTLFVIIFWSYLLIVAMIDLDHKVILDSISLFFFVIFIILKAFIERGDIIYSFIACIVSFIIYYGIYKFAYIYYKKEAFGLGDVFYVGVVGFSLGLNVLYFTIFFPFIVAFIFVIFFLLLGKILKLDDEIPFAPFISISGFILTIYGDSMINFLFV